MKTIKFGGESVIIFCHRLSYWLQRQKKKRNETLFYLTRTPTCTVTFFDVHFFFNLPPESFFFRWNNLTKRKTFEKFAVTFFSFSLFQSFLFFLSFHFYVIPLFHRVMDHFHVRSQATASATTTQHTHSVCVCVIICFAFLYFERNDG